MAGIDAEEAQAAHIGVGHDLERQGGEGGVVVRRTLVLLVSLGVHALDGRNVQGRGHIVHDGIQQLLHALVAVRRAAGDGHHLIGDRGLADGRTDLGRGNFLASQICLHDRLVHHGHGVHQLLPVLVCQVHHVRGDGLHAHILAQIVIVDVRVHLDQVDDAFKGILAADGELDGHGIALQALLNHAEHVVEVGAHDVHLVDIDHPGDLVVIGLAPHSLRLGLHAALGAQHGDRAVQHAQGALHLHGEVHVARSVDDVNPGGLELVLGTGPVAGGGGGRDGDAALLLLGHPVHGGGAIMGLTDLIVHAGVEQDTLGSRRLACIDVSHNADITGIFKRCFSRHTVSPNLPAEMGERLVGLGCLVDFLALLHGAAGVVGGVHEFAGQALSHGALAAGTGVGRQPAQTQGRAAGGTDLHGDLIGGAAHTAGLDFQAGHDILHGLVEHFDGVFLGLLLDLVEGTVDHLLGHALLAIQHDTIDQPGDQDGAVNGIRQDLSLGNITSSGHYASLLHNNSMIS